MHAGCQLFRLLDDALYQPVLSVCRLVVGGFTHSFQQFRSRVCNLFRQLFVVYFWYSMARNSIHTASSSCRFSACCIMVSRWYSSRVTLLPRIRSRCLMALTAMIFPQCGIQYDGTGPSPSLSFGSRAERHFIQCPLNGASFRVQPVGHTIRHRRKVERHPTLFDGGLCSGIVVDVEATRLAKVQVTTHMDGRFREGFHERVQELHGIAVTVDDPEDHQFPPHFLQS